MSIWWGWVRIWKLSVNHRVSMVAMNYFQFRALSPSLTAGERLGTMRATQPASFSFKR